MQITHPFVSAIPDSGNTSLVQPSNWNATHAVSGTLGPFNGGTGIANNTSSTITISGAFPTTLTVTGTTAVTLPTSGNLGVAGNILSTTTNINAGTTGTTTLYTVPTGKTAVVTKAIIRPTTIASFSAAPTLGIGRNVTQDDIFPSIALTGLNATTLSFSFNTSGLSTLATTGELVKVGIDTSAIATTYTISIDLIGYVI